MEAEVSEIFYSLEGEGPETGHPTVYIRFARCNKKCPLWNNPDKLLSDTGYASLDFDPKDFSNLKELKTITRGCDSQYAVNPRFAHMWKKMTAEEILTEVLNKLPGKSWKNPISGRSVILSLTGGEPSLKFKFINELIRHPLFVGCDHILWETNASVPLRDTDLAEYYNQTWKLGVLTTWSNSPKLPNSGESWKSSIVPKVVLSQLKNSILTNQYFKFVVGSKEDLETVKQAMLEYYEAGLNTTTPVYLMPEACTDLQQNNIAKDIAEICMEQGYIFSIRLQNILWGNEIGT